MGDNFEQYLLTDYCDVSETIQQRLLNTHRIKYTCFSASDKCLVFGATSGSLYLFQRSPCKFRHLIPNRTSSVSLVAISGSEKYIAHATASGEIFLTMLGSEASSPERAIKIDAGRITCLHWATGDKCLYFGDDRGRVACVSVSTFIHRSLLNMHTQEILLLTSPILQIDSFDVLLLVTTTSGSIMCNTEREEFKRIGSQARNGAGGACFVGIQKDEYLTGKIFCARPKTRFWEVQFDGNVKQTIDLREALAIPPARIRNATTEEDASVDFPAQILSFHQLQCMENRLIVANTSSGVYIFDPTQNFVLWNDEFSNIHSVRIVGNSLYIFLNSMEVFVVRVTKLCDHIVDILMAEDFPKCLELMVRNMSYVKNHVRVRENLHQVGKFREFLRETKHDDILNLLESIISTPKRDLTENANADEMKFPQKNIKDVIATVIKSKLGKNIKMGLNLLASFDTTPKQESPAEHQNGQRTVFREIEEFSANSLATDEEIVTRKMVLNRKTSPEMVYPRLTDEEKLLRNLYMIYKSSRIGNIRLVERYAEIFDKYTLAEISALLGKLQGVMVENGESESEARRNCIGLYLDYIKPELIWEMDEKAQEFLLEGFMVVNEDEGAPKCESCSFPLITVHEGQHMDLGKILFQFLWSRQDKQRCESLARRVPALLGLWCLYRAQEGPFEHMEDFLFAAGNCTTVRKVSERLKTVQFERILYLLDQLLTHRVTWCPQCGAQAELAATIAGLPTFYSWQFITDVAVKRAGGRQTLQELQKYQKNLPVNSLTREYFLMCLQSP
ncbi:BLOC-2 complex member HPS5 homolog [Phlebotomus argentipes]|uniref:BLOC-2 complex member HPS5 homolog n=1 Tax=Phlebotomus argentipes TaxID=94469 RepID=UPI002892B356|nr:BLOC-2 complex member HPS5 homolog [Phlebotomus argentipes]